MKGFLSYATGEALDHVNEAPASGSSISTVVSRVSDVLTGNALSSEMDASGAVATGNGHPIAIDDGARECFEYTCPMNAQSLADCVCEGITHAVTSHTLENAPVAVYNATQNLMNMSTYDVSNITDTCVAISHDVVEPETSSQNSTFLVVGTVAVALLALIRITRSIFNRWSKAEQQTQQNLLLEDDDSDDEEHEEHEEHEERDDVDVREEKKEIEEEVEEQDRSVRAQKFLREVVEFTEEQITSLAQTSSQWNSICQLVSDANGNVRDLEVTIRSMLACQTSHAFLQGFQAKQQKKSEEKSGAPRCSFDAVCDVLPAVTQHIDHALLMQCRDQLDDDLCTKIIAQMTKGEKAQYYAKDPKETAAYFRAVIERVSTAKNKTKVTRDQ